MSIGSIKNSPSPSFRPVTTDAKTPAVGGQTQTAMKDLQKALTDLSKNPIFQSLVGQSGFDGAVKGKGHAHKGHHAHKHGGADKTGDADKAGGADKADGKDQATSQEAIQKLVDGLKQFVQALEQMMGKKNETQAGAKDGSGDAAKSTGGAAGAGGAGGAGGTDGAQAAGGSEGAGGADGAQAAGGAGGAQEAGGAGGAQEAGGADGADQADDSQDPISQIMDTLKKIIGQLEQLMASLTKQGGATQGTNTGIVGPNQGNPNTGIVGPTEA